MANERMSVLRERRKGNRGREKERQTNKWESGQTTKRLDEQTKNERSNEIDKWQDKEQRNETNKNKKKEGRVYKRKMWFMSCSPADRRFGKQRLNVP